MSATEEAVARAAARPDRQRYVWLAVIFVAAVLLYLPSLRNGFAYDDVAVIQQDVRIHSLGNAPGLLLQPYWADPALGLYRPLTTVSYALDWSVSGGSAVWFHAVNVVWNALACAALFLFLATLAPVAAAGAGALLFALHPVHVEAVANVVGRAELMAAFFSFTALWLWCRRERSRRTTALVAACYALALLSKESAIMLPALLVLADAARGEFGRARMTAWLRSNAGALGVLVLVAVAYMALRTVVLGELGPDRVDPALEIGGPLHQRLTALQAWVFIARVLLVPVTLLADYGPRVIMPAEPGSTTVLLGAAILLALVGGGISAWLRGRPRLAVTLLWVPVALLPVANLILTIGVLVAERALYLPSAAVALGVATALAPLDARRQWRLAAVPLAAAALLFAVRTVVRVPDWRSTDSIMMAQIRDRPDSFRAQWHMARLAVVRNDTAAALQTYGHALQLWPYRRGLVIEAASMAVRFGDLAFAQRIAAHAVARWPADIDALRILAGTALDRGDVTTARAVLHDAILHHPNDSTLLRMRAAADTMMP